MPFHSEAFVAVACANFDLTGIRVMTFQWKPRMSEALTASSWAALVSMRRTFKAGDQVEWNWEAGRLQAISKEKVLFLLRRCR